MTTADDIVSRVTISAVWRALGGGELRHGRGRAFWRPKAAGLNVSVNDARGVWHDFKTDEGGGVLALIQRVCGGTRQDALWWLAERFGLPLEDRPLTPAARQRYARAAELAPALARSAWLWWKGRRSELEDMKRAAIDGEHIDIDALAMSARELYRFEHLDAEAVVRAYLAAAKADPIGTAAIVEIAEAWDQAWSVLVGKVVDHIAAGQQEAGGRDATS